MSRTEKLFAKADKARARLNLPPVRTGFDYAKAVRHIYADHCGKGYDYPQIAGCIGCTQPYLQKLLKGNTVPNHITGELLWGLYVQLYELEKTKKDLLTEEQRNGLPIGAPKTPKSRHK